MGREMSVSVDDRARALASAAIAAKDMDLDQPAADEWEPFLVELVALAILAGDNENARKRLLTSQHPHPVKRSETVLAGEVLRMFGLLENHETGAVWDIQ